MSRWLWLLMLLLCPVWVGAAVIEGRVVHGEEPLAGMEVAAYAGLDFRTPALAVAAPTKADGYYRLEVAAGRYALRARSASGEVVAFCGRNPVAVAGDATVWAGLQAVALVPPRYRAGDDPATGAVEGRVLADGKPLAGAVVSLYLDAAEDLKGFGYRSAPPTAADGLFAFDGLPESGYYLVARLREGGGRVGPVLEGDAYGLYPGNPLAVQVGKVALVELQLVRKAKAASASETFGPGVGPTVRGTVVDRAGQPVAGVHVFAYLERVIGHKRPEAISPPTLADGNFILRIEEPGRYYVGARQAYGDSPAPGELFGLYDATPDHGLEVPAADPLAPLRIVVEPVSLD